MDHLEENNESINMEHVADSATDEIRPGMIIQGEIVTIDSEYAYINVGTKSDGGIALEEFDQKPEVGDIVDVMLQNKRLVDGVYQFSKIAADVEKRWANFLQSYKEGNIYVQGRIQSVTGKGKIIEINDVTAFLPFSLSADLKKVTKSDELYDFKIKTVDEKKKSIIISRKDFLDDEKKANWENFRSKYNKGDRITGKAVKFVEFGAFIRIDGIDALLHRNDMSWKNVFKQRKILKLNEEREFLILDINDDEQKVSLGLKQLTEDPWLNIDQTYKVGDTVSGKVVTLINQGAFVEIDSNIDGFVKNSDLSWTKNIVNAVNFLKKGQVLDLQILEIKKDERKMLLGLKQLQPNPWDTIEERFPIGSVHRNIIKKIVKFGMFVELENEIDGLIHASDIFWDDDRKDFRENYKAGDEVDFKILDINKDEMRISCGIKQLTKSPWELIKEKYQPQMKVEGVISGITDFGLFIKLEENVEGLVHISEVSSSRIENLEDRFKVGEPVKAIVLGVDVAKKRLSLSIKHYDIISEKEELKKILNNKSSSTVALGDMVNIKLSGNGK